MTLTQDRLDELAERSWSNPHDPGIFDLKNPPRRRGWKAMNFAEHDGQAVAPFAYGTKSQEVTLQGQIWSAATQLQWLLPKSGYIAQVQLLIGAAYPGAPGSITVNGAGTAGVPKLWNLINRYSLNVSYGYEYRGMNGDSLYFRNQISEPVIDRVLGSPLYQNYNPASATAQTVGMILKDEIFMDEGIDFDRYLIPYQSFSKQVFLVLTTGQLSSIAANSETFSASNIMITPIITYFTQPDTSRFAVPDTSMVQQILDETKLVNQLIAGTQLVNLTPINGPEYLGLGFQLLLNNILDPVNINTNLDHIRILANSTVQVGYLSAASIIQYQYEHFSRNLPPGWFYFPWSDDISLVNAMGPAQRNVFDTKEYTQLDLEVTIKSTATVGSVNQVKLFKRMQSQAIPA